VGGLVNLLKFLFNNDKCDQICDENRTVNVMRNVVSVTATASPVDNELESIMVENDTIVNVTATIIPMHREFELVALIAIILWITWMLYVQYTLHLSKNISAVKKGEVKKVKVTE